MDEIAKLDIRLSKDLKERFRAVCDSESVNASALIRKWIGKYVAEKERPLVSMDLLDIVWKLHKSDDIKLSCFQLADRLGYDGEPHELFNDVADMLIERAKSTGKHSEVDHIMYGKATINNEVVYFSLNKGGGTWSAEAPEWLAKISF